MNEEQQVYINADQNPVSTGNKKKIIFVSLLILIVVLLVGLAFFINQNNQKPKVTESPLEAPVSSSDSGIPLEELTPKELLYNDIKIVFDAAKYPIVISFSEQAFTENDTAKEYAYFVEAFKEMEKAYDENKDQKFRKIMLEVRNYLGINPAYQENDFPIPN